MQIHQLPNVTVQNRVLFLTGQYHKRPATARQPSGTEPRTAETGERIWVMGMVIVFGLGVLTGIGFV